MPKNIFKIVSAGASICFENIFFCSRLLSFYKVSEITEFYAYRLPSYWLKIVLYYVNLSRFSLEKLFIFFRTTYFDFIVNESNIYRRH